MGIAAWRDENVDHLAMLIDRAVQVGPAAGDLHIGLIDEPAIASGMPCRASCVDELRGEGLHPAVDRDVVDSNAAFGQQLFDIAVGQAVAQLPPHRDRDHLPREAVAGRRGRDRRRIDHPISLLSHTDLSNATAPYAARR